jgi:predicted DNA-binding transcriptional regulator AlpA
MNLSEIFKSGTNLTLAISIEDLRTWHNEVIEGAKKELEDLIIAEKNEIFLSADQTAEMLSVNKSTLWRWEKAGYLVPAKIGGKNRYPKSKIIELLNNGGRRK